MSIEKDYETYRGDTFKVKNTVTDSGGTAIDVSSWDFWFTVKDESGTVVQKNATNVDMANGEFRFVLENSDTQDLLGNYEYDMQYATDDATAEVKTFQIGDIYFKEDITRATS